MANPVFGACAIRLKPFWDELEDVPEDYEDIEQEDILVALNFVSRLVQIKRIEMLVT